MAGEQNVEHYPAQVGSTMGAEYSGHFITCSCQADRFGEGPKIPAREYPAHILANVRRSVSTEDVRGALDPLSDQDEIDWFVGRLAALGIEVQP